MIRRIKQSLRLATMAVLLVAMVATGCKSKKKAMEAQAAAEKARMEQEAALQRQKQQQEEEQRKRDAAEKSRLEAEAMLKNREPKAKLQEYFNAIGNAGSFNSANSSIQEALGLFASDQVPVLIVIHEANGQKDYDRPTTIKDYLNYLKDQKKTADRINDVKFDSAGKITELELIKDK